MADPKVTPKPVDKGEKGNDPVKKPDVVPFDTSTIKDEDFAKIFEDKRLWKHDRFKKLNDRAKKADELEESAKTQKQADLEKNKEWKELAETRKKENEELQGKIKTGRIATAIQAEAIKQGAIDSDAVSKLIDRKSIKVTDDGIEGVAEAVKSLLELKPFLVGNIDTTVGKGTNPANSGENAPKTFKASQLKDVKFFRENEEDIKKALSLGLIVNDLTK